MTRKNEEAEEFRIKKVDFEEMMRKALGATPPIEDHKNRKKKKQKSKESK